MLFGVEVRGVVLVLAFPFTHLGSCLQVLTSKAATVKLAWSTRAVRRVLRWSLRGCRLPCKDLAWIFLVLEVHNSSELQPDAEPPQSEGVSKESLEGGREEGRHADRKTVKRTVRLQTLHWGDRAGTVQSGVLALPPIPTTCPAPAAEAAKGSFII